VLGFADVDAGDRGEATEQAACGGNNENDLHGHPR
jgi:hypothetical protein